MKTLTQNLLLVLLMLCTSVVTAGAQDVKIHKYNSKDGGILMKMTANGQWALIKLGSTSGGGTAVPQLYNIEKETITPITYAGRSFAAEAVSDDANIIVGSNGNRPFSVDVKNNKAKVFPLRPLWSGGSLSAITPDGKFAVGYYQGYNGKVPGQEDIPHDYFYSPLFVNLETGDTIATPGLPKRDMAHLDQNAMQFVDITPDGRYIIGLMSWYIMQPNSTVTFVYDTKEHTYRVVGFIEHDNKAWEPLAEHIHHLESPCMSPDGHWLAGMAYMTRPIEGSEFYSETGQPYRYDILSGKFELIDNTEMNIDGCIIDNNGTIYGNPNTGSPLRDFRILYKDKYWITLGQICRQQYGFNFNEKTGYSFTGTVEAVTGDGSKIMTFVDPLGESYCIDFNRPINEVCDGIDLLDNYSVSPVAGSVFSLISSIDINFGRNVQVLGKGNTHVHLYKEDGTKVADGMSTAGGLALKAGSSSTVTAAFRTRQLEAGVKYYVQLDAGAVAVANDETRVNKNIRINYTGRADVPLAPVKIAPENHSQIRQFDATSYILMTFDCPVKLTENSSAYIERVGDGIRIATLTAAEGNTEETRNQILLFPTSEVYLYEGTEYKVVLEAGSVSDYAGSASSYNKDIILNYHGTYVREVVDDKILFSDSWDKISESLQTWLFYEGDHNRPLASMTAYEFDADNTPWNFSIRDNDGTDYCAASHSLYSPSGVSDDWMMTPQILMPKEGRVILEFDGQSQRANKQDALGVYVFEEDFVISYLNDAWMEDIRNRAVLLDSIILSPGEREDVLKDEWTHYTYDLTPWNGKNIYIAFANQNYNQSMIYVDNVKVEREVLYSLAFSNLDRVVGEKEMTITGQFTAKTSDAIDKVILQLRDADGNELDRVEWLDIKTSIKDRALPFTFSKPLPLTIGEEVPYSISITMGDRTDEFKGTIMDLAFQPVKRVVLEEMTGIDCPNCPQGIIVIEKCEKVFGDQFIPISIHTYTGDPYASGLNPYTDFLGLTGAPMGRINRVPGVFYPMLSTGTTLVDTNTESPLWYDIIARELAKLATADVALTATLSADGKSVEYRADLKSALNAKNQQLSLLVVLLEDGIENYQANNFGSMSLDILGQWGQGGINSGAYAYPVIHNDVARFMVGNSFSGTIGLYPSTLEAGKLYTAAFSSRMPESIDSPARTKAVAMLIDTQTGEIVNAAKAPLRSATAIDIVQQEGASVVDVYSPSGVLLRKGISADRVNSLPRGLYIVGGKKVWVK